jgi:hypothetical protein
MYALNRLDEEPIIRRNEEYRGARAGAHSVHHAEFGLRRCGRGLPETPFFPRPPPPGLSKDLLGRMIAWRIQEQAFGGLDRESLTFLEVWRTTAA